MMTQNKKKYILFFNASKDRQLDVFLIRDDQVKAKIIRKGDYKLSENLLKLIVNILSRHRIGLKNLKGIITVSGPGPFTSLRIAAAVANTLAYSLQIPVIGLENKNLLTNDKELVKLGLTKLKTAKKNKYISPFYNQKPNITVGK